MIKFVRIVSRTLSKRSPIHYNHTVSLKKILPTLILVLLVYGWYFFIHQQANPSKLNVLGASTNLQLYVQPETGTQPLVDAIDSAQKEILVEVYLPSDKPIIKRFGRCKKSRGIDVKVMMEEHPVGGGSLNNKTKLALDAVRCQLLNGVIQPLLSLHEKSITIDGSETFVLSQNLTASAFSKKS